MWSSKRTATGLTNSRSAPCTIFSTTALSPRQIANKAYTLGCKKLDRDDKRSKQKYHVRERLLLCNTIAKAEEVLNTRTRRTNRRVMAAEDEDSNEEFSQKPMSHTSEHHSPLRSSSDDEEEEEEEEEEEQQTIPIQPIIQQHMHINHNITNPINDSLLHRDCRTTMSKPNTSSNNAITTII
ncbi:hypothetical protein A0J61_07716 [Choanephora cucurbitarum]|uniref:Uncharacterized protein n=1 Tax=Choanephora cucurbitarum TaxID=101091 RepID=A0A1C7N6H9_9FUNG|nr:hypothetical protein A0J61_07716 [Choanephora cucurbitarum]